MRAIQLEPCGWWAVPTLPKLIHAAGARRKMPGVRGRRPRRAAGSVLHHDGARANGYSPLRAFRSAQGGSSTHAAWRRRRGDRRQPSAGGTTRCVDTQPGHVRHRRAHPTGCRHVSLKAADGVESRPLRVSRQVPGLPAICLDTRGVYPYAIHRTNMKTRRKRSMRNAVLGRPLTALRGGAGGMARGKVPARRVGETNPTGQAGGMSGPGHPDGPEDPPVPAVGNPLGQTKPIPVGRPAASGAEQSQARQVTPRGDAPNKPNCWVSGRRTAVERTEQSGRQRTEDGGLGAGEGGNRAKQSQSSHAATGSRCRTKPICRPAFTPGPRGAIPRLYAPTLLSPRGAAAPNKPNSCVSGRKTAVEGGRKTGRRREDNRTKQSQFPAASRGGKCQVSSAQHCEADPIWPPSHLKLHTSHSEAVVFDRAGGRGYRGGTVRPAGRQGSMEQCGTTDYENSSDR